MLHPATAYDWIPGHAPSIIEVVIDSNQPLVKPLNHADMFSGMQDCLREVQKLISEAQQLNQEILAAKIAC